MLTADNIHSMLQVTFCDLDEFVLPFYMSLGNKIWQSTNTVSKETNFNNPFKLSLKKQSECNDKLYKYMIWKKNVVLIYCPLQTKIRYSKGYIHKYHTYKCTYHKFIMVPFICQDLCDINKMSHTFCFYPSIIVCNKTRTTKKQLQNLRWSNTSQRFCFHFSKDDYRSNQDMSYPISEPMYRWEFLLKHGDSLYH